jgi:hypothetical protein
MAIHAPITGAPSRASEINRRGLLAGMALAPVVVATPLASVHATGFASPFAHALAANTAAEQRFNSLPLDLEFIDPAANAREEKRMLEAWRVLVHAPPENWNEFATKYEILTEKGTGAPTDEQAAVLMADVWRLTAWKR